MQRLTLTAQELLEAADGQLEEIEQADRAAWLQSRGTTWLFTLLESLRMDALEAAEAAVVSDEVRVQLLTTEARTIKNVIEEIVVSLEADRNEHVDKTRRTPLGRPTRPVAPKI